MRNVAVKGRFSEDGRRGECGGRWWNRKSIDFGVSVHAAAQDGGDATRHPAATWREIVTSCTQVGSSTPCVRWWWWWEGFAIFCELII